MPECRSRNGGQGLLLVQSLIWSWQVPVWQQKVLKCPVAISGIVYVIALAKVSLTSGRGKLPCVITTTMQSFSAVCITT